MPTRSRFQTVTKIQTTTKIPHHIYPKQSHPSNIRYQNTLPTHHTLPPPRSPLPNRPPPTPLILRLLIPLPQPLSPPLRPHSLSPHIPRHIQHPPPPLILLPIISPTSPAVPCHPIRAPQAGRILLALPCAVVQIRGHE
jgi:hypothetical protein